MDSRSFYLVTSMSQAVFLVMLLMPSLLAQMKATLEVRPAQVSLNQQLTLTITTTNSNTNEVEQPSLPTLMGFRVVSGPNVSSQFQWINGRSSSSKSYSYVLLPTKKGTFTLGPVEIQAGSEIVFTNSFEVTVDEEFSQPTPAPRRNPTGHVPSLWDEPQVASEGVGDQVFVTVEPDRVRAYPGQQITLTYKVYTQLSISSLELKESPSLKGFWVEDIQVPKSPSPQIEHVRGRDYSVFEVKKQALFATSPGTFEIPASTFALGIRVRSNDPFSFFSLGITEPVYRRASPKEINIIPFPKSNRPPGFSNLTGRFSITSKIDKTEAETGEAIALTLSLTGTGNLNTVGDFDLPQMPDLQIFSSKSSVQNKTQGDFIEGTKTWEYVIVPQAPGRHTITPISVSYFEPATQQYDAVSTDPLHILVARSSSKLPQEQRVMQHSKLRLTRQGSDVNFIKLASGPITDLSKIWYSEPIFYLLLLLPVAATVSIIIFQQQSDKLAGNVLLQRKRRASKQASLGLKMATKHLNEGDLAAFHGCLATSFSNFIGDRFGFSVIDLTRDQIVEKLTDIELPDDAISQTVGLLDRCDFARFAPSQVTQDESQAMLREVKQLVRLVDKSST